MNSYIQLLDKIVSITRPKLLEVSSHDFAEKPSPDKWSKKEILGHLIDSAYNNHQRFLRASQQDDLVFWGYDQVDWVRQNDYQHRELTELVHSWATVNFHLARLIAQIPPERLNRETVNHNFHQICMNRIAEGQASSLGYLVWDYLFHLEHHLVQLLPTYHRMNAELFKQAEL